MTRRLGPRRVKLLTARGSTDKTLSQCREGRHVLCRRHALIDGEIVVNDERGDVDFSICRRREDGRSTALRIMWFDCFISTGATVRLPLTSAGRAEEFVASVKNGPILL